MVYISNGDYIEKRMQLKVNLLQRFKKIIGLLFIIITMVFSLHPEEMTAKELNDKIKEAQAFFDEGDYNKAIIILTEVVNNNPDRLDQVVSLMNRIAEIRNIWNKKYRELIVALYEEENAEKALKLIEEMEDLERNPNEVSKQAIRIARISAELVFNKVKLREIMDEAKKELDKKNYFGALTIYASAFNLGKQTYDESSLISEIDKNTVYRAISTVYDGAKTYIEQGESLLKSIKDFENRFNRLSKDNIKIKSEVLISTFNDYSSKRSEFYRTSSKIDENHKIITDFDKNAPERFYLDFSKFLVYGRDDVDFFEGIISVTDHFWEDQFLTFSEILDQRMIENYQLALDAYLTSEFDRAEELLNETLYYASISNRIYKLINPRLSFQNKYVIDRYSENQIKNFYGKIVDARVVARATDTYLKMINLRRGFSKYEVTGDPSLDDLYALRVQINADIPLIDNEESLWNTISQSLNWLDVYKAKSEKSSNIQKRITIELAKIKDQLRGFNLSILTKLSDRELSRILNDLSLYSDEFERNKVFLDGFIDEEVADYTGDANTLSTYPDRALPGVESLMVNLVTLSNDTNEIINTFESGEVDLLENSSSKEFLDKIKIILPQIQDLNQKTEKLETLVRDNIFLSEGFKNQGAQLLDSVRVIVSNPSPNREEFDRARENLKDANNAYYESFNYNENLTLRKSIDREIETLQQDLLNGENRLVVEDVRDFINKGKEAYINRKYGRSRVFLDRARNRWLTTNTEEHPEILYWMALVDLALQFDKGRTISKTEPLYDEMTQFLNLAYGNYNKGLNLISEGKKEEGLNSLDIALGNLENVTIYMPQNESASLLRLKIAQLRDPAEFRANFSSRIDDAWKKLQSNSKTSQSEGYTALIDLSKIDEDYPGLQNKITIAEFDILKTRIRPPNPRDLAESQRLYNQAFSIVQGGVRSQYGIALTWLDQAVKLNPNNSQAISLKDKIQVDTGGKATIVLPSALESRFREAQLEFEQGNFVTSYAIIVELKKDGRSAKYPPLLQLEERVKLKLQI